jgi:hypothetical protein
MRKVAVAVILMLVSVAGAPAVSAVGPCVPSDGTLDARDLPRTVNLTDCDISGRRVSDGSLSVVVPPPGFGAGAESYGVDSDIFAVETSQDGIVTFLYEGSEGDQTAGDGTGPPACEDTAYNLEGHEEDDLFQWYFNADSTPGEITKAEAESALRAGIINITHSENNCGMGDNVSATSNYLGRTNRTADMDSEGGCATMFGRDQVSVVDFGNHQKVGKACWWYVPLVGTDELLEGDFRLNKADYDWTVSPGTGCSNDYDVESVATHEWGHIFGMAHVAEDGHANLTMSTQVSPCTSGQRTLGRGDVLGLRQIY